MKRSLTQQTVAGMAWMIYGKVAFAILQLVILGILARLLVPADFGVIAAAEVVIGFSAIVSQLGLGPALVQRAELEDRHIETAFSASVVLGLLLGAIIWFGAGLAAALILTAPAVFLGADGQWMLETLRTFLRRLRPAPAVEPAAAVTVE
jgi:PST family polysaccharide transporter